MRNQIFLATVLCFCVLAVLFIRYESTVTLSPNTAISTNSDDLRLRVEQLQRKVVALEQKVAEFE